MYDGTRYLTLFGSEKHDAFYNRVKYVISIKRKVKVDSHHYLSKKDRFCMIFQCSLNQFLIKLKLATAITYFWKNARIN